MLAEAAVVAVVPVVALALDPRKALVVVLAPRVAVAAQPVGALAPVAAVAQAVAAVELAPVVRADGGLAEARQPRPGPRAAVARQHRRPTAPRLPARALARQVRQPSRPVPAPAARDALAEQRLLRALTGRR